MVLGMTGHRPTKLGGYKVPNPIYTHVRNELRKRFTELAPTKVVTGMALGVDQWAAELCIELGIPFVAAVPFQGQELAWPTESQKRYLELLKKATEVVYVSGPGYSAYKMHKRNAWIVDHCDTLLAVWDGTPGGTKNCVDYATQKQRNILRIDPHST